MPCIAGDPDSVDLFDWAQAFTQNTKTDFARVAFSLRNAIIAAHGQNIFRIWEADEP